MSPDLDRIQQILRRDPVWAAYALADLQPAFQPYCQWQIGESAEGEGVVLLFTALHPPIIFTMGPVTAVRAALWQMKLPEQIYITAPLDHYPSLAELYSFRGSAHQMYRLVFAGQTAVAHPTTPWLVRLGVADSAALQRLYALGGDFAPDYFEPYQVQDGVYFGVRGADGELIAAGGTHILDRHEQTAAIGNMYTRAEQRGLGHGTAILQAIVATLIQEGFQTLFLNVDRRNTAAQVLYTRLGFTEYCRFMEGTGIRRK
jgi:ribosomal protein S18 acetylase RimI-like enzyme